MEVDIRLKDIDDCLYRVAARVLIVQDNKVLLVRESTEGMQWSIPGGGVDHGETVKLSLTREIEEELGVAAEEVSSDFEIVYYSIGSIVNGVPRMNLFFKASVPKQSLKKNDHTSECVWFTKDEFTGLDMHPSYNKAELGDIIFN
jgi:8-oxo-dGTP pyrophosphatase MutT (NUDIX family)